MIKRRDTLLIGVLVNTGLLAILFITAIVYDVGVTEEANENGVNIAEVKESSLPMVGTEVTVLPVTAQSGGDEVDNMLKFYAANEITPQDHSETEIEVREEPVSHSTAPAMTKAEMVEVTIKRGDSLDKIARANGTSVSAIKKANQMVNERLSIGQIIKVPVKKKTISSVKESAALTGGEAEYYVIKSGDNPWKLSKQLNVKYEDILQLNNLDDDKARNLKAGDRIRIK